MIVRVRKHHLQYFRNKVRKLDNEIYAFLVGVRVSPTLIQVERFLYPKLMVSTPSLVVTDVESDYEIEEIARLNNWSVVGSIHSHPNWTPELSGCDLDTLKNSTHTVSGVVSIINNRTYAKFWVKNSPLIATIQYY